MSATLFHAVFSSLAITLLFLCPPIPPTLPSHACSPLPIPEGLDFSDGAKRQFQPDLCPCLTFVRQVLIPVPLTPSVFICTCPDCVLSLLASLCLASFSEYLSCSPQVPLRPRQPPLNEWPTCLSVYQSSQPGSQYRPRPCATLEQSLPFFSPISVGAFTERLFEGPRVQSPPEILSTGCCLVHIAGPCSFPAATLPVAVPVGPPRPMGQLCASRVEESSPPLCP